MLQGIESTDRGRAPVERDVPLKQEIDLAAQLNLQELVDAQLSGGAPGLEDDPVRDVSVIAHRPRTALRVEPMVPRVSAISESGTPSSVSVSLRCPATA